MTLLQAKQLELEVPGRCLCRGLDLAIEPGQCWAVLGPNGAGKSTLLHTLAGLRTPDRGDVLLDGRSIQCHASRARALRVGLLLQDDALGFPLSLLESALAGRHPHLGRWGWESADDIHLAQQALADVGLDGWEQRQLGTLSGGERRRLAIARLLTQQPALALLDEPNNHLDLAHQIEMLGLLRDRFSAPDHALVMVLHDINLALRFCGHLLLLPGDGSWEAGDKATLATEEHLSRLYGYEMRKAQGPAGDVFLPA